MKAVDTMVTLADTIAAHLNMPPPVSTVFPGWNQSLATGAAGIALLHIERAHTGTGAWQTAHSWLRAAAGAPVSAAEDTSLFFGAPALAFTLYSAGADGTPRYASTLTRLNARVAALAHRRLDRAHARIDRGELPAFAEYDLLGGLTGIGAHLLRHDPGNDALGRILTYLVRLTTPLRTADGDLLPGWWAYHDPHLGRSPDFPGGHGNLGIAHGITGPLALLAHALRRGIVVDGHTEGTATITNWLHAWRQHSNTGPWWPQWITRHEHHAGVPRHGGPLRPSWCYGTPGLARAQQLAAIATHNPARQQAAEDALLHCLSDAAQVDQISDTSLCHGWAGVYLTTMHVANEAFSPALNAHLAPLADQLIRRYQPGEAPGDGLLEGDAGVALASHTAAGPSLSGWETCLLIT